MNYKFYNFTYKVSRLFYRLKRLITFGPIELYLRIRYKSMKYWPKKYISLYLGEIRREDAIQIKIFADVENIFKIISNHNLNVFTDSVTRSIIAQGFQGHFLCQEDFEKYNEILSVKTAYELFLYIDEIENGLISKKLPYFLSEKEKEKWRSYAFGK